jgi:hypothetical protein
MKFRFSVHTRIPRLKVRRDGKSKEHCSPKFCDMTACDRRTPVTMALQARISSCLLRAQWRHRLDNGDEPYAPSGAATSNAGPRLISVLKASRKGLPVSNISRRMRAPRRCMVSHFARPWRQGVQSAMLIRHFIGKK